MKALSVNMTEESPFRHIAAFALPMLLGNLLQQVYNLADTLIVGKYLGDNALAAVGATGSVTYFFYTLCLGLLTGAGIIISQFFGAGIEQKVKSAIFNSGIMTLFFGTVVSIISVILTEPVLRFMNTPENLISDSAAYMKIVCGGTIAVAAYNWIMAVMRALGDSKTPLIFLGLANVLNVGLDLLFVVVFGMGISGAAAATVLAQGFSAVCSIIYGFAKNKNISLTKSDMRLSGNMLAVCFKTGMNIAVQNATISVSMIALQRVTNSFGETVMAAYTVTMRIEQLIQQPFSSLSAAMSTFTGQNAGAARSERMVNGYHIGMKMSTAVAVVVMAIFLLTAQYVVGLFVSGEDVISIGAAALRLTSCFYLFLGTIHVTRGFLNGAGDTTYAMINGLVEVVCRIAFSLILTKIAFIGYYGIWATTAVTWLVTAAFSVIRYKQGTWRKKSLVTAE